MTIAGLPPWEAPVRERAEERGRQSALPAPPRPIPLMAGSWAEQDAPPCPSALPLQMRTGSEAGAVQGLEAWGVGSNRPGWAPLAHV